MYMIKCKFNRSDEFKCVSGQCVIEDAECDGRIDCIDGSDEMNCANFRCAGNLFQCQYGACIRKIFYCDGKKDCKDNSDELKCKNISIKPPETCGQGEFQCNSGQCISEELLCDGKADCADASDETVKECSTIPCAPQNFFRCDYGACLAKSARCNDRNDCIDGSDEKGCPGLVTEPTKITPKTKPTPTKSIPTKPPTPETPVTDKVTPPPVPDGCLIPKHPSNGEYRIGSSIDLKPGNYAPPYSAIVTMCKNNYKVNPTVKEVYPLCMNGQWSQVPPTCERACPAIYSTKTTIVKCKYRGTPLKNCDDPVEDTIANLACEPLYEEPGISNNPSRVCKDGSWNYPVPQCLPICGQKRPLGVANVVGGTIAKENDYPWHVGIYNIDNSYLCGGSIISLKVIISAAHCFTDPNGKLYGIENFKIAGGKYHREINDERDKDAQISLLQQIYIPERYKGTINNYEADIAVVVLRTAFKISQSIQPVCLDRTTEFEYLQLADNNVGVVVGWGYTDYEGNLSDELKEIYVPFRSYADCYDKVSVGFRKFLTFDKICAGYLLQNQSVCRGDSGGGLAFEWNQNRYYIRGIVSTSPTSYTTGVVTCDAERYGTYTLISKYIEYVRDIEILNPA
ncbi:hypothetical protein FQA39_LY08762 [Lamprigera yunnana]|nr:hypothetical protein FQA39_LY08762 [Lamprigera yunnana]